MANARELWFVVAGNEKARLLRGTAAQGGRLHVEEVATLTSTFAPGEHHRPTRLGQPGSAPGMSHEHEEGLAHFARELSPWLEKELGARTIATCPFFAPSHMVGALRKKAPKSLAAKLREQEVDLIGLSTGQLATHPKIKELVGS